MYVIVYMHVCMYEHMYVQAYVYTCISIICMYKHIICMYLGDYVCKYNICMIAWRSTDYLGFSTTNNIVSRVHVRVYGHLIAFSFQLNDRTHCLF